MSKQAPLQLIQITSVTACFPTAFARAQISKTKALLFRAIAGVNQYLTLAGFAGRTLGAVVFRALAPHISLLMHVPLISLQYFTLFRVADGPQIKSAL